MCSNLTLTVMVLIDNKLKMSGIVISITAGATVRESSVTATGQLVDIIADSERASFGIGSDADVKKAIGKYFGKEPYYAFLKSPTPPFGDLYKEQGWSQVQRVLKPIKAEILGIKTKPTIVSSNTLTNTSKKTATFTANISEQVTDSVSTEWSFSSRLYVEQTISYKLGFLGTEVGGETKFGLELGFGVSKTWTKEVSTGMDTGVSVELKPGESAIVELSASSGIMHARVTYEAYLIGETVAHYSPRYKDHENWRLPIGAILGGSKKVQVVEDIEVGYYSKATARVRNANTDEEMLFHLADHPTE